MSIENLIKANTAAILELTEALGKMYLPVVEIDMNPEPELKPEKKAPKKTTKKKDPPKKKEEPVVDPDVEKIAKDCDEEAILAIAKEVMAEKGGKVVKELINAGGHSKLTDFIDSELPGLYVKFHEALHG